MRTDPGILFVSGTLEVGGSETKVVKIANALADAGYSVGVAYLNSPETLRERISSTVSVVHLDRQGKYSIDSVRRLRRLIDGRYRVVLSVNFYPLLYVLPAAWRRSHGRVKTIALINTSDFVDGQWIWGHFYAPFLRRCDQLVYGCEAQQQSWTMKYRLPTKRSTYIYNGVDSAVFSPDAIAGKAQRFRSGWGIPSGATVIGSVGRLAPEKCFEILIQAIGRLGASGRDAYLVLAGDGKERSALQATAGKIGVSEKVIFTGVLEDVRPAILAMDVFVLPSRAVETFSNAALEAMAMARPAILTKIGGAAEMIEHGKSGYLFEIGDIDSLVNLLVTLYDSGALREQIGEAARKRVLDQFRFETMLDKYRALFDSLLR